MDEPNWSVLRIRMMALTLKELKPVRKLFGCSLGCASGKFNVVDEMVSQTRHWWLDGKYEQVEIVLGELARIEYEKKGGER